MKNTVIRVIGRGIIRSKTLRNKRSKLYVEIAIIDSVPCVSFQYLQLSNLYDVYAPIVKRFKHLVLLTPTANTFKVETIECVTEFANIVTKKYYTSKDKNRFIPIRVTYNLHIHDTARTD